MPSSYAGGNPALRRHSLASNVTIETHQTRWADVNSLGDVYVPIERVNPVNMRGGGGSMKVKSDKEAEKARKKKEKKERKEREKLLWRNLDHSEALHFLC
jgi:hypothetical protein